MNRKILVSLATLLAAGAVAVGSGATFTSSTGNTISAVTAGTLTQSNSKSGQAIFNLTNLKPGDTLNGSLALTNTGSLPASFSLTEVSSSNTFTGSNLTLDIVDTTAKATVYSGSFGGLADGTKNVLGKLGRRHHAQLHLHREARAGHAERRPGQDRRGRLRLGLRAARGRDDQPVITGRGRHLGAASA